MDSVVQFNANIKEEAQPNNPDKIKELQNVMSDQSTESGNKVDITTTSNFQEETFKTSPESNFIQKIFGKISSGSLTSSIFSLCILSLGTGSLALPQKIGPWHQHASDGQHRKELDI